MVCHDRPIRRILQLEEQLNWHQFRMVNDAIKLGELGKFPIRALVIIYLVAIPVSLVASYLVFLAMT